MSIMAVFIYLILSIMAVFIYQILSIMAVFIYRILSIMSVFTYRILSIMAVFTYRILSIMAVFTNRILSIMAVFTYRILSIMAVFIYRILGIMAVFIYQIHSLLSTGSTQEYPSRHNWKSVDWDIKNQIKQNKFFLIRYWVFLRFCLCNFESDTVKSDWPIQVFMKMMKYLKVYRLLVYLTLSFTVCYGDTKKKLLKKKELK